MKIRFKKYVVNKDSSFLIKFHILMRLIEIMGFRICIN